MSKLKYVNKLLQQNDLTDYIKSIEENIQLSPSEELKERILKRCYEYSACNKPQKALKFIDIIKVACFVLIIIICTELFMTSSYATTKTSNIKTATEENFYKITIKLDELSNKFSNYILDYNLKGEK